VRPAVVVPCCGRLGAAFPAHYSYPPQTNLRRAHSFVHPDVRAAQTRANARGRSPRRQSSAARKAQRMTRPSRSPHSIR